MIIFAYHELYRSNKNGCIQDMYTAILLIFRGGTFSYSPAVRNGSSRIIEQVARLNQVAQQIHRLAVQQFLV